VLLIAGLLIGCSGSQTAAPSAPTAAKPEKKPVPTRQATAMVLPTSTAAWPGVAVTPFVQGLKEPVYVTNAGDGSRRLFVIERPGRIMIVREGTLLPTPFLDLTASVRSKMEEQGLFSVAFHPR
jgi:glucose/arabinose dehydrogenase